jgi:hypothetical protein
MIGINRTRVKQLPQHRFEAECLKLSVLMKQKGWTGPDDMPSHYAAIWLVLHEEYLRRGTQLRIRL